MAGGYEELPGIRWVLFLQLVTLTDGGQVLAPQSQITLGATVHLLGILVHGIQCARCRCRCGLNRRAAIRSDSMMPLLLLLLLEQTLSLQLLPLQFELLLRWLRQQFGCLQFGGRGTFTMLEGIEGFTEQKGKIADAYQDAGAHLEVCV